MIYQFIQSLTTKRFKYEPKLFQLYIKHSIYIGTFIFLHLIPVITLILLIYTPSHIEITISTSSYKNLLSLSLGITALIPCIMCIIRVTTEITQITFIHKCLSVFKNKICTCKHKLSPEEEAATFPLALPFTEFANKENFSWKKLLTDIFVGLSYSFKQTKKEIEDESSNPKDIESYLVHEITDEEYREVIEPNDSIAGMPSNNNVTFIEYAPQTFKKIRNMDHIDHNEMYQSFLPTTNIKSIENINFTESSGNSTIFLSTSDNKFILKTITEHEYVTATYKLLPRYIKHIEQNNQSLLCPIYGIFKIITFNGQNECLLLVMRNMIGPFSKDVICKFNLKGSTRNRNGEIDTIDLERIEKNVLKDIEFNEAEKVLLLTPQKCEQVRDTIKNDVTMLRDLELMDYALFVIKVRMNKSELYEMKRDHDIFGRNSKQDEEYSKDSTDVLDTKTGMKIDGCFRRFLYHSLREGTVYVLVITDYLQDYNVNKKTESTHNITLSDKPTVPCVEPNLYCERFIEYINKITDVKGLIKRKTFHTSVIMEESGELSIERDLSRQND